MDYRERESNGKGQLPNSLYPQHAKSKNEWKVKLRNISKKCGGKDVSHKV